MAFETLYAPDDAGTERSLYWRRTENTHMSKGYVWMKRTSADTDDRWRL
ncbi:hypothetical protein KCP74_08300 [Salmonella enterica subsp. enterica]|nr:hypothetical protein KCP74_08300 [Salmonella enterica subsp. enterica]